MIIVLSGKTASGKDTIKSALLKKYPNLRRVITTTSRTPRAGEVNGVDYYFLSEEEFKIKISNNEFLESVEYGGNLYGTEKTQFTQNGDILWKIDPSRAGKVRKLLKDNLVVIYVTASDEVILERLEKRGLPQEEIAKRMADDKRIWDQFKDKYDYVVENMPGKLQEAVNEIIKILEDNK